MTYEEKLTERLNTYTKEDLINLYLQIRFQRDLYLDMYSETQRWHNTIEEKPTEEKQYLCCSMYMGKPYFKVLRWSNNLYEVDKYDFSNCKGENGFYTYDSEYGYVESGCDYWKPIDWYWEPIDWSDEDD